VSPGFKAGVVIEVVCSKGGLLVTLLVELVVVLATIVVVDAPPLGF